MEGVQRRKSILFGIVVLALIGFVVARVWIDADSPDISTGLSSTPVVESMVAVPSEETWIHEDETPVLSTPTSELYPVFYDGAPPHMWLELTADEFIDLGSEVQITAVMTVTSDNELLPWSGTTIPMTVTIHLQEFAEIQELSPTDGACAPTLSHPGWTCRWPVELVRGEPTQFSIAAVATKPGEFTIEAIAGGNPEELAIVEGDSIQVVVQ